MTTLTTDKLLELLEPPAKTKPSTTTAAARQRQRNAYEQLEKMSDSTHVYFHHSEILQAGNSYFDLLYAYARLTNDRPELRDRAKRLVSNVSQNLGIRELILAFASLCDVVSVDEVVHIVREVRDPVHSIENLLIETDTPGTLPKAVYDALFTSGVKRDAYLIYRLRTVRPRFSREQEEFARTLALEWDGTLNALLETVRTLRPKPDRRTSN
jgi:hypothetical protein